MAKLIVPEQMQPALVPFPLIPLRWEWYLDVPFVIPALTFPWDIFHSIEQEYYQHLHDSLREDE